MKKDYVEIKFPKWKDFAKNPWMVSTVVLLAVIIAGAVLFSIFYAGGNYSAASSSNTVSPNQAGQSLASFLNANTNSTVQFQNATEISGVYQVNILYQGQTIPVYTTEDGRFFIQSMIPIQ